MSTKQPYIYTLPEGFLEDKAVPTHWRLWALINGFFISGKTFYATNKWIEERLGVKQWAISTAFTKLEEMKLIRTERTLNARKVFTYSIVEIGGSDESLGGQWPNTISHSDLPLYNSESNSVNLTVANAKFEIVKDSPEEKPKTKPKTTPEMQSVFDIFDDQPQRLSWRLRIVERDAAQTLFEEYGLDLLKSRYSSLKKLRDEPMCPQVYKPSDFLMKMPNLENFMQNL